MKHWGVCLLGISMSCNSAAPNPVGPEVSASAVGTGTSSASPSTSMSTTEPKQETPTKAGPTTFADDLAFLQKHGEVVLLKSPGGGQVAVSPTYQGRVMTSAVEPDGQSLGFVHRAFIEAKKTGTQFDNYGGEDRFWLGPEAGQFGLYFPKGTPFTIANWKTPDAFQVGAWKPTQQTEDKVVFQQPMKLENYSGSQFELNVARTVRLLPESEVFVRLVPNSKGPPPGVKWVAFETEHNLKNTGKNAWTESSGLLSIWILGMYNPSPDTRVVIPFDATGKGEVVNDRYFGKVPAERLRIDEKAGVLFFSADGQHRSKIGLSSTRARQFAGSYSAAARLLTVIQLAPPPKPGAPYVNSMWEQQKEPFKGDVINSYNDGPTEPGKPSLGGFYELESSSQAIKAGANGSAYHVHRTFHFVGEASALDPIAKATLGVTIAEITASK